MASQTEVFFEHYAATMDAGDAGSMSEMHLVPCIFVSDEKKLVCAKFEDILRYNQQLINSLHKVGVVTHAAQVNQAMRLSETILFSNVRWQFKNAQQETVLACYCSYTLQVVDKESLRIIVAVVDDEDKAISKLLEQQ